MSYIMSFRLYLFYKGLPLKSITKAYSFFFTRNDSYNEKSVIFLLLIMCLIFLIVLLNLLRYFLSYDIYNDINNGLSQ